MGPIDYTQLAQLLLSQSPLQPAADIIPFRRRPQRGEVPGIPETGPMGGRGGGGEVVQIPPSVRAYHGTKGEWRQFDPHRSTREAYGSGLHAAPNPKLANKFSEQFKEGGSTMPLNLRLRKTASQETYNEYAKKFDFDPKQTTRALIKDGYDSVRYNHGQFYTLEGGKLNPSAPGEDAAISVLKPNRVWSAITGEKVY